jgi:DNA-binding GntR family transcriptional regulator
VTDELFEARQAYEARVRRLAGAAGRGRSAPALARLLLDARRALRGWDVPAMERTLAEFDRACS